MNYYINNACVVSKMSLFKIYFQMNQKNIIYIQGSQLEIGQYFNVLWCNCMFYKNYLNKMK